MFLDLSYLNPEQRKAVEEIYGPCMIIAGAGSGKTRVLTYKIAYLIASGISPYKILALTFTNKAAEEMKARVEQLSPMNLNSLWIGTFHSMFARLLRIEAEHIGYTKNYSIYDTDDSINVIKRIMQEKNISPEKISPTGFHSMISKLKNKLIYPNDYEATARTKYEIRFSEIYKDYQSYLRRSNSMDFDDLLLKPIELFNSFPAVLEKYQTRFEFILVDEYQDTNRAQYEVLKLLSEKHKNISVVGDDAQSIYKWRGAEIQNIFDFEVDFSEHKLFKLEQNYRSTKKILSIADEVIKKNCKQIEKILWTDNKEGEPLVMIETMTDKDEAYRIVKYISDEIQKRKINFKDFAVLYRTNSQSRLLEDALRNNDIPYVIIGGIRFYQRKEIKDVLSYFRIIINGNDNEALVRVLNLKEGIGKTTIDKLNSISENRQSSLLDAIKESEKYSFFGNRTKNKLKELLTFIQKYQYLKDEENISLSEISKAIVDEIGVIKSLKNENTPEAEERINNIDQLISAIAEFSDEIENAKLEDFLSKVSLVADIDELDNKKNAVTLMTIHAAKGLEFKVVFITGLEEGLFPVTSAITQEDTLEEERRLFYVAITRAKEKLYISFANQRYRFGSPSYQMKSRFLKELTPDIIAQNAIFDGYKLYQTNRFMTKSTKKKESNKGFRYESIKFKPSKEYFEIDDKFPEIKKGAKIHHDKYGSGTVMSTTGKGIDKKAEIYFEEMGVMKIILKYAKMRIEDS